MGDICSNMFVCYVIFVAAKLHFYIRNAKEKQENLYAALSDLKESAQYHKIIQFFCWIQIFSLLLHSHPMDCQQWVAGVNLWLGSIYKKWCLRTFASDVLKIRNFQTKIQRKMAVDTYYNVYIFARHKYALSLRKGMLCVTYIYTLVGVGVSFSFLSLIFRSPNTSIRKGNVRSKDSYANIFWIEWA